MSVRPGVQFTVPLANKCSSGSPEHGLGGAPLHWLLGGALSQECTFRCGASLRVEPPRRGRSATCPVGALPNSCFSCHATSSSASPMIWTNYEFSNNISFGGLACRPSSHTYRYWYQIYTELRTCPLWASLCSSRLS